MNRTSLSLAVALAVLSTSAVATAHNVPHNETNAQITEHFVTGTTVVAPAPVVVADPAPVVVGTGLRLIGKPSVSLEYDFHNIEGRADDVQTGAVRLNLPTTVGRFDIAVQGARVDNSSFIDRGRGFEIGYSFPVRTYGDVTITPRVGYGTMLKVDLNGRTLNRNRRTDNRYLDLSLEASKPLTQTVHGFVNFAHLNGYQSDSFSALNRLAFGVDFKPTSNFTLRTGLSARRIDGVNQTGVLLAGTFAF